MQNNMKLFNLVIFSMLFSLCLLSGCQSVEKPTFKRIENIKVVEVKDGFTTISANAIFNNPNSFGVTISKTDMKLFIEGKEVGDIVQSGERKIPAAGDFTIPVTSKINVNSISDQLAANALKLLTKKGLMVEYKGKVYIKAMEMDFGIPVSHQEEMDVSKLLNGIL